MLILPAGNDHAAHVQSNVAEGIDQPQHVRVVGDAQVAAQLVFLDVVGVDDDHQLRLILEVQQHTHFAVRPEARQHAGSVVVVKQLAAQLQIQLAAELADPFQNMLRLHPGILLMIKTDFHTRLPLRSEEYITGNILSGEIWTSF